MARRPRASRPGAPDGVCREVALQPRGAIARRLLVRRGDGRRGRAAGSRRASPRDDLRGRLRLLTVIPVMLTGLLLAVVFIPMLLEARVAAVNERAQRARGGLEPSDDVYAIMRVAYP